MGLFGRARKMVAGGAGSAADDTPQFFEVHCIEGHPIRGRRTEGYQALRCPDCGAGVFVLPRSPLPEPPAPPTRVRRALPQAEAVSEDELVVVKDAGWQIAPESSADDEIEWMDAPSEQPTAVEPEPSGPEEPPLQPFDPEIAMESVPKARRPKPIGEESEPAGRRGRGRKTEAFRSQTPNLEPAEPRSAGRFVMIEERETFRQRLERRKPLLVFLGVGFLLVLTVFFALQRQWRRDYPRLAERGRTEGIEALKRGEFDKAHQILSQAARAVDALRGEVGGAAEIQQAAREAAIYVDLVPVPLESILDERARALDDATWNREFERNYKGRAILIEGRLISTPGGSLGRYDLDYRVLTPGPTRPRVGRIDLASLVLIENTRPRVNDLLQFGARLAAVEPDPEDDGWVFRLEPESGVTMTHSEALEAIGWKPVPFRAEEER